MRIFAKVYEKVTLHIGSKSVKLQPEHPHGTSSCRGNSEPERSGYFEGKDEKSEYD